MHCASSAAMGCLLLLCKQSSSQQYLPSYDMPPLPGGDLQILQMESALCQASKHLTS